MFQSVKIILFKVVNKQLFYSYVVNPPIFQLFTTNPKEKHELTDWLQDCLNKFRWNFYDVNYTMQKQIPLLLTVFYFDKMTINRPQLYSLFTF